MGARVPASPEEPVLPRVARGDAAAVQACIDRFGGLVWSLARRLSEGGADAEDAVQEIFVDLWKSAGRFDPAVASEAAFVAVIARRRLIDRRRQSRRRPDVEPLPEAVEALDEGSAVERSGEAILARKALEQLRPEQRRVLLLGVLQGLSHDEIASVTGMPLGTVKAHARRGLLKVRSILLGEDEARRACPVDGGVFEINAARADAATGEVIVPVTAKLRVRGPTLFAVTVEKPGGVVVSPRERAALVASPKG